MQFTKKQERLIKRFEKLAHRLSEANVCLCIDDTGRKLFAVNGNNLKGFDITDRLTMPRPCCVPPSNEQKDINIPHLFLSDKPKLPKTQVAIRAERQ